MIRSSQTDDVFDDADLPVDRVLWPLADNNVTVRGVIDDADVDRYLYDGSDIDPEVGLQYHQARHYDPTVARWIKTKTPSAAKRVM